MIRHLFKLIWSRKKSNILLITEIIVSFIVIFALTVNGLTYLKRAFRPIGFNFENVYSVGIDVFEFNRAAWTEEDFTGFSNMIAELEQLPEVEVVAIASPLPFGITTSGNSLQYKGKEVYGNSIDFSVESQKAFSIELVDGRWFNDDDNILDWEPVIINQMMAEELFGSENPVGKRLDGEEDKRIVGVVDDLRTRGKISAIRPLIIDYSPLKKSSGNPVSQFIIKTSPGTEIDFEVNAAKIIQGYFSGSSVTIELMDVVRKRNARMVMTPFIIALLVCFSLIFMVILGMIGVFWQSVTARTEEIGLRRAMGGSRDSVFKQLLGEIIVITLVGSSIAVLLIIQLPLLGVMNSTGWSVIFAAIFASLLFMILLGLVSGFYPAILAARIQPAQALHYD